MRMTEEQLNEYFDALLKAQQESAENTRKIVELLQRMERYASMQERRG